MGWRPRGGTELTDEQLRVVVGQAGGADFGADVAESVWTELKDQMAKELAQQLNVDLPAPRPNTVRWYQVNGDQPVTDGSTVNIRQACHFIGEHRLVSNSTVRGVDMLCGFMHRSGLLPPTNRMPRCDSHPTTVGIRYPAHVLLYTLQNRYASPWVENHAYPLNACAGQITLFVGC